MGGKWLEVPKEVAPPVKRAAIMFNPDTAPGRGGYFLYSFEAAGAALSVKPIVAPVRSPSEIERVIGDLTRESDSGLVLPPDIFLLVNRKQVMTLAERHKLPVVYWEGTYAEQAACSAMAPTISTRSADRHLRRSHPERRDALLSTGACTDQICDRDQPQDRQGDRPRLVRCLS